MCIHIHFWWSFLYLHQVDAAADAAVIWAWQSLEFLEEGNKKWLQKL